MAASPAVVAVGSNGRTSTSGSLEGLRGEGGHHAYFGMCQSGEEIQSAWREAARRTITRRGDSGGVAVSGTSSLDERHTTRRSHASDGMAEVMGLSLVGSSSVRESLSSSISAFLDEPEEPGSASHTDDDDDERSGKAGDGHGGGIREWCPHFYGWIQARSTTRSKLAILVVFVILDCARFVMFEYAVTDTVNTLSVFVMSDLTSLIIAVIASVLIEGQWALRKIFNLHGLWRWMAIAALFVCGTGLNAQAYKVGLSPSIINLLGKSYLPMCAIVSYFLFRRRYGKLEWLSISMLMLSISAFIMLRERCHWNHCHALTLNLSWIGAFLVVASVAVSGLASILAERIYKDKSVGLARHRRARERAHRYYIFRAQLDLWTLVFWVIIWVCSVSMSPLESVMNDEYGSSGGTSYFKPPPGQTAWFGKWTKRQYCLVAVLVGQHWLAGLVVQRYSTVSKAVAQTLSTVLVVMLGDPIRGKYDFGTRAIPSFLISVVVVLSALIFQTGRINMKSIRDQLRSATKDLAPQGHGAGVMHTVRATFQQSRSLATGSVCRQLCKYSTIVLYILADSFRSEIIYVVQANRFFIPQTMAVMSAVCGVGFASVMTLQTYGVCGLRQAWTPSKIQKFLVCGAMQAITTSLSSMAYALGTSPSLVVALGKVYTPLVAVFSRCILGKFFMWLEWFSLIILTAASFTFGILETMGDTTAHAEPIPGMICVVGSAASSCLMSLLMERVLKTDSDPFIMQKVRLDFGSIIFSIVFLPVMGALGTLPGNRRTDVAYWVKRTGPDYWACQSIVEHTSRMASNGCDQDTGQLLVNWTKVGNSTFLRQQVDECFCGSGILLGWGGNYMIYVGLLAVVFHSWITGVLVSQFSSVYRAVADGVPVLLIYFLLDPLFSRIPLHPFRSAYATELPFPPSDWARSCVCLVLPLSGTTFTVASAEMQRVVELSGAQTDSEASGSGSEDDASEDRSDTADDSSSLGDGGEDTADEEEGGRDVTL